MAYTYHVGTAQVTNGSPLVKLNTGNVSAINMKDGDMFIADTGTIQIISSRNPDVSPNELTLTRNFDGTTNAAVNYMVVHMPIGWGDIVSLNEEMADEIRLLGQGLLTEETIDAALIAATAFYAAATAPGMEWKFQTATADAEPGDTFFRLNNATLASATLAYIDVMSVMGDATAWIDQWDISLSSLEKGFLYLTAKYDKTKWAIYRITNTHVDATNYRKVALTHVASAGTWLANEVFNIQFIRTSHDGRTPGVPFTFSTTVTDADPGNGFVRFNNASIFSVTQVYVDNLTIAGVDVSAWLDTMDDSANANGRGYLTVTGGPGTSFSPITFRVTGAVVNGTGYRKIPVAYVAGALPSNSNAISLDFTPAGSDAQAPGPRFTFSTTTTDADPGNGGIRLNNANPSLATFAYIDNQDLSGASVTAWIDSLDNNENSNARGYLTLQPDGSIAGAMQFAIVGDIVDGTGYRKIPISYISGALPANGVVLNVMGTINGADALSPGFRYAWQTAITSADPGAGGFRLGQASPAPGSTVDIRISYTDLNANNLTNLIQGMDDVINVAGRGRVRFQADGVGSEYMEFNITGVSSDGAGTYMRLTAVFLSGTIPPNGRVMAMTWHPAGADGYTPGPYLQFDTATAAADPGPGKFRFNNATIASVTQLFIDDADQLGASIATYLDLLDDRTNVTARAFIVFQSANSNAQIIFRVTGSVTNSTGYRTITVIYVSGTLPANGSFWNLNATLNGADGRSTGIKMTFSTTTTAADPGNGVVRFNSATFASITQLYIDDNNSSSQSIAALLDTLDDNINTNHGGSYLVFNGDYGSGAFAIFRVTAVVNSTGYRTLTVAPISSHTTGVPFNNSDTITMTPAPNGADGRSSGVKFAYYNVTTDADPGAGGFRANSTTFASITHLYVDNLAADGADVTAWLDSFDDVSNVSSRGTLILQGDRGSANALVFKVTGPVVDGTGYRKIPVTPMAVYASMPGNGTTFAFVFVPSGSDSTPADDSITAAKINTAGATAVLDKIAGVTTSAFGRGLLDEADAPAARTTLGALAKAGDTATGPMIVDAAGNGGLTVKGQSTSAILKLERTGSATGSVFLGTEAGSLLRVMDPSFINGMDLNINKQLLLPYQPAFHAYAGPGLTGPGTLAFTALAFQRGGTNYSTSTYRFTAPVAGAYSFSVNHMQDTPGGSLVYDTVIGLYKNGTLWGGATDVYAGYISAYLSQSLSAVINLAAGDYVEVKQVGANSKSYGDFRNFCGFLLG